MNNLVIVESPAKSKTLKKFLGKDFEIIASYGHIRDLIPKSGAVDPEHDFAMQYQLMSDSAAQVKKIIAACKKADNLYLATDPDREGEAISWHLCEILKEKKALNGKNVYRIAFHEITKRAVQEAIQHPRQLSPALINAQQARRALDYLVGFNLSPLLWKKVQGGLSAGRVQSPALRMIAEREDEIEAFKPREYWTLDLILSKDKQKFPAKLFAIGDDKVKQFDVNNAEQAEKIRAGIEAAARAGISVSKIQKKQRRQRPVAPFTTSTLQQDAVRKLGLSTSNTMRLAQQLYEGIDLGDGPVGLITYMRTDSVALSNDAIKDMRTYIQSTYGDDYLPDKPNVYKAKSKNAQEAHEAIRPTQIALSPKDVASRLDRRQLQLYELIWKRALASQMTPAVYDTVSADFACGDYVLRANGSTLKEPGYLVLYKGDKQKEAAADNKNDKDKAETTLPELQEKDVVALEQAAANQHFTEPPPRYSEASLVKSLEEHDIGRPSTYASIIATLQNRRYAELEKKRFFPTDVGRVVNRFLTEHFTPYVDYKFTANLEDRLDEIARGEREWVPIMEEFWKPFKSLLDDKETNLARSDVIQPRQLGTDPKSGKPVSVKLGRYGPFAQIGTREDEEKPLFAGLRPGQKMDTITLEEALLLFTLPRHLGETPEGEKVEANIGRFGPYIKYGAKYVSLHKDDDPHTVELPRALELIAAKKKADLAKIIRTFEAEDIQILKGRWGPYVTDGSRKIRLPKDADPEDFSLQQCQDLLATVPVKKKAAKKKTVKKAAKKTAAKKKAAAKKAKTKKKTVAKKTADQKESSVEPKDDIPF